MDLEEQLNNQLLNLIKIQKEMQTTIDKLVAENTFLTETITTQKLGKTTTERKELHSQMYFIQNEANTKLEEAQKIRLQYEKSASDAEFIKKSLFDKEQNIDKYIMYEANRRVSSELNELEMEKVKCKKILDKQICENNNELAVQISLYKHKRKKWIIILTISIFISILSICINFI